MEIYSNFVTGSNDTTEEINEDFETQGERERKRDRVTRSKLTGWQQQLFSPPILIVKLKETHPMNQSTVSRRYSGSLSSLIDLMYAPLKWIKTVEKRNGVPAVRTTFSIKYGKIKHGGFFIWFTELSNGLFSFEHRLLDVTRAYNSPLVFNIRFNIFPIYGWN